eukprot:CAMPEP_0182429024 /NCGR_PEP_ID=MMETSP1167-20130531/25458_1 /TAXON_ID=2988 /ORGANISM="Mallomonas Sp, Strain CCMP3275" /LENGTH=253 /DNA_ID=CAMNT_0024612319 /DNA_START=104 /DNA_END=865 /DNA_ORIENTATION=-
MSNKQLTDLYAAVTARGTVINELERQLAEAAEMLQSRDAARTFEQMRVDKYGHTVGTTSQTTESAAENKLFQEMERRKVAEREVSTMAKGIESERIQWEERLKRVRLDKSSLSDRMSEGNHSARNPVGVLDTFTISTTSSVMESSSSHHPERDGYPSRTLSPTVDYNHTRGSVSLDTSSSGSSSAAAAAGGGGATGGGGGATAVVVGGGGVRTVRRQRTDRTENLRRLSSPPQAKDDEPKKSHGNNKYPSFLL